MTFESLQLPEPATGSSAPYSIAQGLPYEYPLPEGVVGSALHLSDKTPKLFQPLRIGNMVIPNRVGVSPMCQYTADKNEVTDYHKIHYGGLSTRGPGVVTCEVMAVAPNSGTSMVDLGIWNDTQAYKLKDIVNYAHANTSKIGLQIGHAGRKAMTSALFDFLENWDPRAIEKDLVGPSAVAYRPNGRVPTPRALTVDEIHTIIKQFGAAAKRSVEISGFDFVEIHAAHGYLINEFMSAHSNKRTDQYGGSFENRIRLLLEIIDEVRANVPKGYPVFLRFSASEIHDSNPDAWNIADSVKLAPIVAERGIDLIDVSAGGNDSNADRPKKGFGMFLEYATAIKKAVGDKALVSCVGSMHDAKGVNELLEEGLIDFAFVGSPFLKNPGLVFDWAKELDTEIHHIASHWPFKPKYAEMIEYIKSTLK
ncbi:NADH:flavin oxidoreductase/12-oxophytodienoate reductase [Yamadazyma tenuis ATCC 10573]|uniref:NADH:flavin oxidoreductase/12-oxophytodienoate reductase n=2 Tax=Candida tenuis TaxID=2315449 RepID=G3AXA1_CANTC|nr:NADH:flavin oxidoreductase/12-oxophytodienoate reductase [Yamadazyma tenuis ATCC 10573]EGV66323.1 NADH:flavin oxidoreductase/12-oxophytodienoate reductase [Yamadazyma tenuis ATCC 10573]